LTARFRQCRQPTYLNSASGNLRRATFCDFESAHAFSLSSTSWAAAASAPRCETASSVSMATRLEGILRCNLTFLLAPGCSDEALWTCAAGGSRAAVIIVSCLFGRTDTNLRPNPGSRGIDVPFIVAKDSLRAAMEGESYLIWRRKDTFPPNNPTVILLPW
jgi:hypothetical protein